MTLLNCAHVQLTRCLDTCTTGFKMHELAERLQATEADSSNICRGRSAPVDFPPFVNHAAGMLQPIGIWVLYVD